MLLWNLEVLTSLCNPIFYAHVIQVKLVIDPTSLWRRSTVATPKEDTSTNYRLPILAKIINPLLPYPYVWRFSMIPILYSFFISPLLLSVPGRRSLRDILDLSRRHTKVSSPSPPISCLLFLSRIYIYRGQHSFPLLVDFDRKLPTHALAFSANIFFMQEKVATMYVYGCIINSMRCSVRPEPTKMIFAGHAEHLPNRQYRWNHVYFSTGM